MYDMAPRPAGLAGLHPHAAPGMLRTPALEARGPGARGGVEVKFASGGAVPGASLGRADQVNATVPAGTYILPADVVSGLGEGNSAAGIRILQTMFAKMKPAVHPQGHAKVRLSGGEFAVTPDMLIALASIQLDHLIQVVRQTAHQDVSQMPPPR